MRIRNFRFGYAEIVATLALIMASTGTAYAAATVGTADIQNGAVTTPKLADEAVAHAKLAPDAVTSANVADNTISLADIVGANVFGTISFTVAAHTCNVITLTISGAAAGQSAIVSWTGGVPAYVMFGPARVLDAGHLTMPICNLSGSTVQYSSLGVHIVTFG